MTEQYAILAEGLTKNYGKARGITNLDLKVEKGNFFGFIGPNGAGKSTTIRTLLGLIGADGGRAEVLGMDIVKQRNTILSKVGYLPSEVTFYNGMRVKDVLVFSARLRNRNCSAEAKDLCDRLELDINRKVSELSFGNRKKVGIVCALQHSPELYIMDEPTGGLDPLMQHTFFELLKERNRAGATVFLSSHFLSEVQKNCTHAAIIRDGKILVSDTVEHLGHAEVKRINLKGIGRLESVSAYGITTEDGAALAGGISGQIRDIRNTEDGITFLYSGRIGTLMNYLSAQPITDITITEPDLEEIFMHFYGKEATV